MKWNESTYGLIERRVRNIRMHPPLWDGVCAISAHAVERALHRTGPALHDMGVDHGGVYIFMPEEFLDCADVISVLKQMCCKAVPEGVAMGGLCYSNKNYRLLHRPLYR